MAEILLMPSLSPTMTQGNLVKWHKSLGEMVRAGDLLLDIETDKAVMEVEATQEGILAHILVEEGTHGVQVGSALAILKESPEEVIPKELHNTLANPPLQQEVTTNPSNKDASFNNETLPPEQAVHENDRQGRILVSPLAKKLAIEADISLSLIHGTGPNGRIVKRDVHRHIENTGSSSSTLPQQSAQQHRIPVEKQKESTKIAPLKISLTPMRKTIGERLSHSKQTIPHFYLSISVQVDALLSLKGILQSAWNIKLSLNDWVVHACAKALQEVSEMNTLWAETQLLRYPHADLSVAVALPEGLITPILFRAETYTLKELSTTLKSLIQKARDGKLHPADYVGGTFTISNLGMFGITQFQPIINPPQSGILGVGAVVSRPAFHHGTWTEAKEMSLTLAADHRVVDGSIGARFLKVMKDYLEEPHRLLT